MNLEIEAYNQSQDEPYKEICQFLAQTIHIHLPEAQSKIWHAHPVWFLNGNPIVGYSHLKAGIRLMFWSGASFDEPSLPDQGKKFKDASMTFKHRDEIPFKNLEHWLQQSKIIQWDYKNIVKRKGVLERLK